MQRKAKKRIHPVEGYPDNQNMWEKLLNVEKTSNCPPTMHKHTNNRHQFLITVQDKVFKIKKNPNYLKSKAEKNLNDQKKKGDQKEEPREEVDN